MFFFIRLISSGLLRPLSFATIFSDETMPSAQVVDFRYFIRVRYMPCDRPSDMTSFSEKLIAIVEGSKRFSCSSNACPMPSL